MLKHKIAGIVMGSLILSGVILGETTIHNINRVNNTKVINKVFTCCTSKYSWRKSSSN